FTRAVWHRPRTTERPEAPGQPRRPPRRVAALGPYACQPAQSMGATAMSPPPKPITRDQFDAVLFDLDGVLTSTAKIHSRCWKTMFDDFLSRRAAEGKEPFRPFGIETDYKLYVDGKPRYEGVRSFLASRNISLSEGTPEDLPTA